ncbi:nucleoside 2-deoxyribosyltransferase [bacterium]|nr:nucleoside 2-deoxyribosyltransferase [bacterium]NUN46899.1 nucleoside 2-deoxyribosyltransferase [bacterium]
MKLNLYLSASIINAPINSHFKSKLDEKRISLILPQEFTFPDIPHSQFPKKIYEQCISEMENSDAGIILLDAFGIDCASEAGWYAARNKPLIGIVQANCRFFQNWMVKGNLNGLLCLDKAIYDAALRDTMLTTIPILFTNDSHDLTDKIFEIYDKIIQKSFLTQSLNLNPLSWRTYEKK